MHLKTPNVHFVAKPSMAPHDRPDNSSSSECTVGGHDHELGQAIL
jgi:hypothetical protein